MTHHPYRLRRIHNPEEATRPPRGWRFLYEDEIVPDGDYNFRLRHPATIQIYAGPGRSGPDAEWSLLGRISEVARLIRRWTYCVPIDA